MAPMKGDVLAHCDGMERHVHRNQLGNFVRERRMDLGLTQEQLAERIGLTVRQAEISRLERGAIALPRRDRLRALAAALEVSVGALLVNSGWLTDDERGMVDSLPPAQVKRDHVPNQMMLDELDQLREMLLTAVDRIAMFEATIRAAKPAPRRPEVAVHTGLFDEWESSTIFLP